MATKSITAYIEVDGDVLRIPLKGEPIRGNISVPYHQRVINTYYELECKGELAQRGMSARAKQRVRDIHTAALDKAYWGPGGETGED